MIKNGGFPFTVYSILYDSCLTSITDYLGEVIGYDQHPPTIKIHSKAIRAFIGLPKNSSSYHKYIFGFKCHQTVNFFGQLNYYI